MPTRARPRPTRQRIEWHAALRLAIDSRDFGGHERIGLLRALVEHGTLTRAAQAVGISYKNAWDAVNAMNELAGQPLVERATGGRGGGFTRLTPYARRLVERYEQVDAAHRRFVQLLSNRTLDLEQEFSPLRVLNMKTSARNQWVGTVAAIRAGAVNDEVEIELPGCARLCAIITHESTQALGLRVKQTVIALAKSSAVLLATELGQARLSARNRLEGTVTAIETGAVNAEVTVQAGGSMEVVAIVTRASVARLGLAVGAPVTALVKASDLILAVAA